MRKFRLIKEYPGSPKLGTIVEKDERCGSHIYKYRESNSNFGVLKYHVEDNPEYWEEIKETIGWSIWKTDGFFKSWTPYKFEGEIKDTDKNRFNFKTKEAAKEFVIYNKPCLSFSDLIWNFKENTRKNRLEVDINDLYKLIEEKQNV